MKAIIVTGGSRGLGLEIVKSLLDKNYFVINMSRTEPFLSCGNKENFLHITTDLKSKKSLEEATKKIYMSKQYEIYGLINNAAIASSGLLLSTSISTIEDDFKLNFFTPLYLIQMFSKKMIRNNKGVIINIGSTSCNYSDKGTLSYSTSKSSLIHASKIIANELSSYNINVNSISPSFINTDMYNLNSKDYINLYDNRFFDKKLLEPNDVIQFILFLLTDNASSINGQNLVINNGMV